ncbi:PHD-finger [Oesophagostomum dentatum]|uniref:PHD-finger n=1 Tax=Oesophagostomum dentatum TaxID=61180 RepID=A0A0B1T867_OESDE|nr:PHD-finger [Oesophagostomum dentatum]
MPGAVLPVTERAPSLRISLRKKAMAQAQETEPASPAGSQRSTRKNQAKKRGRPAGAKTKAPSVSKAQSETKIRSSTRGRSSRTKHSKPWEYDDGEDQYYDYVSCSESESSSSEEEYSYAASNSQVQFLEDEQDDDCITNDDSYHPTEEDVGECSRLPWVDLSAADIPPLELPESSQDIPIPLDYLLDTVELYELLRSYWRTLRLTPFLFEDFCAALLSPENSCLLAEIHIVLIRMCFKNDDEEQVHYSGNETNNAYNIITACLEPMTYAEILRQYLASDVHVPAEVMEAVNAPNYPFVGFSARLVLITFLSYRFLYSNEYKKVVVASGGKIEHEETCRSCCKGGELLQCETCEAAFHMACLELEEPPTEFTCELCEKSKVRGVQDCLPFGESTTRQPLRMEPIGRDRHGRFYWFVVRRIFVHNMDETDLRYYSTAPQFYQLIKKMDPSLFEFDLCNFFYERLSDILEQMSVTLELSSDRRDTLYRDNYNTNKPLPAEVFLQQDNMRVMADILSLLGTTVKAEEPERESEVKAEEEEDQKPFQSLDECFKTMLGFSKGSLVNNFWSGNVEESELLQYNGTRDSEGTVSRPDPSKLFRMGNPSDDNNFSKYSNLFVEHKFGEHPTTKKKMVDKKKYLCTKFSLMEEGEWAFEWSIAKGHNLYGNEKLQTLYVAWTIGKLLRKIPTELMHRKWPDVFAEFKKFVIVCNLFFVLKELDEQNISWKKLRELLLRSVCFDDPSAGYQSCYSQECRQKQLDVDGLLDLNPCFTSSCPSTSTSCAVKAYDPSKTPKQPSGVLGEDLPWPLPEVNHFLTRGSKRTSIFVLPQVTLRRLAKTGGRKAIYVPSFSASAKGNLQYWNYPTPRPCFDLCWRWLTVNCASLQAVALQLRILWASVRWQDMKPDDDDPDRRIVTHFPDRDERRWISSHKEYAPPCIYERYRISIEVLPLDDDREIEEEDDLSWTSGERAERRKSTCFVVLLQSHIYYFANGCARRKRAAHSSNVQRISHVKEEWVDGVDLKLHEIYDYWKGYNEKIEAEKRKKQAPPPVQKDYEYYSALPDEQEGVRYEDRSDLASWEPRAAKRPRPAARLDSARLLQTLTPPSRVVPGRQYQVGVLRGGGRTMQQYSGSDYSGMVAL